MWLWTKHEQQLVFESATRPAATVYSSVCVDERAYAHTVYAVASDGQGHAVFTFPAELRVTPVAVRDMSYSM